MCVFMFVQSYCLSLIYVSHIYLSIIYLSHLSSSKRSLVPYLSSLGLQATLLPIDEVVHEGNRRAGAVYRVVGVEGEEEEVEEGEEEEEEETSISSNYGSDSNINNSSNSNSDSSSSGSSIYVGGGAGWMSAQRLDHIELYMIRMKQ